MAQNRETTSASERSPLLVKADRLQANSDTSERIAAAPEEVVDGEANEADETSIKEPTSREVALVMGSLYLGVFFAALGAYSSPIPW